MLRTRRVPGFVFVVASFVLAPGAVSAQSIGGDSMMFDVPNYGQSIFYGSVFTEDYRNKVSGKARKAKASARAEQRLARAEARASSTRDVPVATVGSEAVYPRDAYRVSYDPSVSDAVKSDYIRGMAQSTNEKTARELDTYYTRNDVRDLFNTAIKPYGLRDDDLADITSAHLVVMWMTANDAPLPTTDQVHGVVAQIQEQMAESGANPPDAATRQRIAEAMMYQTVTLIRVREQAQAQNATQYLATLADSAQDVMARQNVDLRALSLTSSGLELR